MQNTNYQDSPPLIYSSMNVLTYSCIDKINVPTNFLSLLHVTNIKKLNDAFCPMDCVSVTVRSILNLIIYLILYCYHIHVYRSNIYNGLSVHCLISSHQRNYCCGIIILSCSVIAEVFIFNRSYLILSDNP